MTSFCSSNTLLHPFCATNKRNLTPNFLSNRTWHPQPRLSSDPCNRPQGHFRRRRRRAFEVSGAQSSPFRTLREYRFGRNNRAIGHARVGRGVEPSGDESRAGRAERRGSGGRGLKIWFDNFLRCHHVSFFVVSFKCCRCGFLLLLFMRIYTFYYDDLCFVRFYNNGIFLLTFNS